MLSIGAFSRICMVSAKTLRHYDAIGLLTPRYQNGETGYRYYEVTQFADMWLINKLKTYGFSLVEIGAVLHAEQPVLQEKLKEKFSAKKEEYRVLERLLSQMEHDIQKLEEGIGMTENQATVTLTEKQPMEVVSVREVIAIRDFDKLFAKLGARLGESGVKPVGAPTAIYHSEDFDPEQTDLELAWPVAEKGQGTRTMAGGPCASALHRGAYAKLNETYMAVGQWVEQNGYRIEGSPFEVYVSDPRDTPEEELITEVCFPVARK